MYEISVDELKQMIDEKEQIFILDVRQKSELVYGLIKNSTLIQMHEIPSDLDRIPKDRKVIVYCRSGNRSRHVTLFLRNNGIEAYNLKGGILAWKKYDNEVVDY
jgi:phage shock protein E